jgi:CheY-specific phosphatase CheX
MSAFGTTVVHDAREEPVRPPQDGILAIIGFGGAQMRGSLVLSANCGMLRTSFPVKQAPGAGEGPCPEHLQDWAGELANQLLGRFKYRLLGHGITLQLGTPTTVSGLELRVRSCGGQPQSKPLWLYSGDDWLVVRLDAIVAPEVTLSESPDSGSAAAEGEVLLFSENPPALP